MKKPSNLKIFLFTVLIAFQVQAWTNSQQAADRLGATQVKDINFDKNSSTLTEAQKNEIRQEVSAAQTKGEIDQIKILAWSDKEYPGVEQKLSKIDNKLAKNRLGNLKSFIKSDLKLTSVNSYNMSEQPNALQKLFNTNSAQVKATAVNTGAAPDADNTGLFDMKAQASKAVIMIFLKK